MTKKDKKIEVPDRVYEFRRQKDENSHEIYRKKESELNDEEIKILFGTLVNEFRNMPLRVQGLFLEAIKPQISPTKKRK